MTISIEEIISLVSLQLGVKDIAETHRLVEDLGAESADIANIVATLEEMGAPDANSVSELAGLLSHQNADVGYWAATLLGRCGEAAGASVPALTASLSPPAEDIVQQRSAWALGKIGQPASGAVPALQQAAHGDDARLARLAKKSLDQIGG